MDLFDIDAPPFHSRINQNGRIVIPAELRELMGVKPGDAVVLTVSGGVLRVESYDAVTRKVQESVLQTIPTERCLSEELIAERREEVRREMEESRGAGELIESLSNE